MNTFNFPLRSHNEFQSSEIKLVHTKSSIIGHHLKNSEKASSLRSKLLDEKAVATEYNKVIKAWVMWKVPWREI